MLNFKCPSCVEQGIKSRVSVSPSGICHWPESYYDEEGENHHHTIGTSKLECSNGHAWLQTWYMNCWAKGCDWDRQEEKIEPFADVAKDLED